MPRPLGQAFASTDEVAEAAGGVTRHTLRRWCEKGVLPEPTRTGVARRLSHVLDLSLTFEALAILDKRKCW